jgi:hypothetical protein
MGALIADHEIYIQSLLELFNVRFGPAHPDLTPEWLSHLKIKAPLQPWLSGGIDEIAALQKEFGIFRAGRPFLEAAALLGVTGALQSAAKKRWVGYLAKLPEMSSDNPAETGDQRIVNALLENFDREGGPLPCFMQAHDGRRVEPGLVAVAVGTPLFYLESVRFLIIHLPMRPEPPTRPPRRTRSPRPGTAASARGPRQGGRERQE